MTRGGTGGRPALPWMAAGVPRHPHHGRGGGPLSAAARPEIPAPSPATLPGLTASTLDRIYAANTANAAEAARMAAAHGDTHRAAADREMAAPDRHLLTFDGRGPGKATEVFGDLARADHVAVLVPGSDTSLDTYGRFRATAAALQRQLTRTAPHGTRTAVVAWLGYRTPDTISTTVLTTDRADEAAPTCARSYADSRASSAAAPPSPSSATPTARSSAPGPRATWTSTTWPWSAAPAPARTPPRPCTPPPGSGRPGARTTGSARSPM